MSVAHELVDLLQSTALGGHFVIFLIKQRKWLFFAKKP